MDAHRNNCLIRKDGSAVLIDFELSFENVTNEKTFSFDLKRMGQVSTRWEKTSFYLDILFFRPLLAALRPWELLHYL